MPEYDVYLLVIDFLINCGWQILCASPPTGTDVRFRRCLLPRRVIGGSIKGDRDEVDVTAHDGNVLLLVECKTRLSESLRTLNALGESDYDKLMRIKNSFSPQDLAELIKRGTGLVVPHQPIIALAIAVEIIDAPLPNDMCVIDVHQTLTRLWLVPPLSRKL